MRIQVLSDLHIEFNGDVPPVAGDVDVLVCAGDLHPWNAKIYDRIARAWSPAREIVFVPGNHEYYGRDMRRARREMARWAERRGWTLLDGASEMLEGIRFIGATLWTDFALDGACRKTGALLLAQNEINDFKLIRAGTRTWTAQDSVQRHEEERGFLEQALGTARAAGDATVVVTHHGPSTRSIAPRWRNHPLNPAFASDLDRLIMQTQPLLWIQGHTHDGFEHEIGRTRLICNPRGYRGENREFDPAKVIEVQESDCVK